MREVGAYMKRWIFFVISAILYITAVLLYYPYIDINSSREIIGLVVIFLATILLLVALIVKINRSSHQKITTLQSRLSMWSKLSYHISQAGDEIFTELPIGMLAIDEEMEIKWSNPHAQVIFGRKVNGKNLKDIHEMIYTALMALAELHELGWIHGDIKKEHFRSNCYHFTNKKMAPHR